MDAGVMGENKAESIPEIDLPKHRTLGDVLAGDEAEMAEVLHMLLPKDA